MIKTQIYTIGHSRHPWEVFLELLRRHDIEMVIDVRRFATSRKFPHFRAEALREALTSQGMRYISLPELGGYRRPRPDSPNTGLTSPGFRGYADYMLTPEFQTPFERLVREAREGVATIMCAEGFPWRCHRWFLADRLLIEGFEVWHILPDGRLYRHRLHPQARIEPVGLIYAWD